MVPDGRAAELARKGAEQLGVLVEIEVVSPAELPIEDGSIDLAVVDDTGGLFGLMSAEPRAKPSESPTTSSPSSTPAICGH